MSQIKCPQCGSKLKKKAIKNDGLCPICSYSLPGYGTQGVVEDVLEDGKEEKTTGNDNPWNLEIDYHTSKPKVKMIASSGKAIKDVFTNGTVKQYQLPVGTYIVTLKAKRKIYDCLVLIAPGDEPVRIHFSWKRKVRITMEQSQYAATLSSKLDKENAYLRFLKFIDWLRRCFLAIVFLMLLIPLWIFIILQVIIILLKHIV